MPIVLLTPAEAAERLRCKIGTLRGYVARGELRYVAIGHGPKRPRKLFDAADLDDFIERQKRWEGVPANGLARLPPVSPLPLAPPRKETASSSKAKPKNPRKENPIPRGQRNWVKGKPLEPR